MGSLRLLGEECRSLWRFWHPSNALWRAVVFYSESTIYAQYFDGVIRVLTEGAGQRVSYLTSDERDPLLAAQEAHLRVFYVKRLLPFVLLLLDARVLVMTMADLHRFHLLRSVRGAHHVYLFHALVSTHMVYRGGAFDHYDSILCAGPHQAEELARAKALYGRPRAALIEAGYPRLDRLLADHQAYGRGQRSAPSGGRKTALIAPSWGVANILETCVHGLARLLHEGGYRVIVRPHPEFVARHPAAIAELTRAFAANGHATLELDPLSDRSLHEAELLITDWSGIALEYAFGTERPVVSIETPRKVHNLDYERFGLTPLEVRAREEIGVVVPMDQVERVLEVAAQLEQARAEFRERIVRLRAASVFHLGASAQIAADHILGLCRREGLPPAVPFQAARGQEADRPAEPAEAGSRPRRDGER